MLKKTLDPRPPLTDIVGMPVRLPLDPSLPDMTMPRVREKYGISITGQYLLIKAGEIESFLFAGQRVIVEASILAYRNRCKAKGAQMGPPVPGPRPRGRPRKHPRKVTATEQSASAEG